MPKLTPFELEHYEQTYEQLTKKAAPSSSRRRATVPLNRS